MKLQKTRSPHTGSTMKIIELNEVDSTSDYLKRLSPAQDTAVFARVQTAGKGTKGRSFISDDGGLYMSFVRFYGELPADRAFSIMMNVSVAVCRTLESLNLKPRIRWANDVLIGDKKISGTLIENSISGGFVRRSLVGVGININNVLHGELKKIAVSAFELTRRKTPLEAVGRELLKNLQTEYSAEEYKSYIDWLGSEVKLTFADGTTTEAIAKDITPRGALVVSTGGVLREINSGEVTLRLQ